MQISMIAAIGKNNELGKDNNLIWRFKEDMKFFKDTTMNHPVVMGRKTFESLPKVLHGRKNIVLSSKKIENKEIEVHSSFQSFLDRYKNYNDEIFIIGGESIYKLFINFASKMYLTEINAEDKSADVFYPRFNKEDWTREELYSSSQNGIEFTHVLYKRMK